MTIEQIMQIVGSQQVEIIMLRQQVADLKKQLEPAPVPEAK